MQPSLYNICETVQPATAITNPQSGPIPFRSCAKRVNNPPLAQHSAPTSAYSDLLVRTLLLRLRYFIQLQVRNTRNLASAPTVTKSKPILHARVVTTFSLPKALKHHLLGHASGFHCIVRVSGALHLSSVLMHTRPSPFA